jgi:uncharacterized protein
MKLHISKTLSLPMDLITQTQAILAMKGAGKSYTASVQAEEFLKAGQQIVAVDPTGAWYGLKSSADGKSPGFPIAIFGGDHADVPLEDTAGEVLANAVVNERFSAILDLSLFRKGQVHRFMTPFLETLYRRNREAMHLFVDEADVVAPQKPFAEEARTLGAMEDIVRRGRIRGIGCTMITQRPAVLNKNVLTQAGILCALRISHPKDIAAIREWVEVHADVQTAKEMMESLPSLPIGTAWLWSPGWGDIFEKVKIRERETFNSGATPKAGERIIAPKAIAQIDIAKLGAQIAATVQRIKENDPTQLRNKVRELEAKLRSAGSIDTVGLEQLRKANAGNYSKLKEQAAIFKSIIDLCSTAKSSLELPPMSEPVKYKPREENPKSKEFMTCGLSKPQLRILEALAEIKSIGTTEPEKAMVGGWSGYSPTSGGFNNLLGQLRAAELIEYPRSKSGCVSLTHEGEKITGIKSAPSREEFMRRVHNFCSNPQIKILDVVTSAPLIFLKEDVAERSGYSPTSGGFNNLLGELRSKGLIHYPRPGYVAAVTWLFEL